MRMLSTIRHFAVALYESLVEARKLQAKNKFMQNGMWY